VREVLLPALESRLKTVSIASPPSRRRALRPNGFGNGCDSSETDSHAARRTPHSSKARNISVASSWLTNPPSAKLRVNPAVYIAR